ncbi:hypothetical protein MRX96_028855 [Rhipicephalus microplus]
MGQRLQDPQLLSAPDDQGPLAPTNSLESTVEDSHASLSEANTSPERCSSNVGFFDKDDKSMQQAEVRGDHSISMNNSEETTAHWPSFQASVAFLICAAILLVALLVAFAYGAFFQLGTHLGP